MSLRAATGDPAGIGPAEWILVVEDDASDELLLRSGLAQLGVAARQVRAVHSLASALEAIGHVPPGLAIVDLGLPDSHGTATVRRIREVAPELPLLVISGESESAAAFRSLEEGADDYLVKGEYGPRELGRALRYARERRRLWVTALDRTRSLEAAERRFRSVVEGSMDGMLIVDGDGVVRFANAQACRMLSGEGDLVGSVLGVPLGGDDPVDVESAGESPLRLEMRLAPIEWDARGAHLVVLRDTTAHRTLEERLRQTQKMEALGQLTGGIAHDFNNVLAVVLGGIDALGELTPAESHEAHAELREIASSVERAAGMVRRLLGFSRRSYLRFETIELSSFAEEALALTRRVLPEHIEVRVSVGSDVGRIWADPAALQQILLNLATNARDAMPRGGTLEVACNRERIEEGHDGREPWVRPGVYESVMIVDNGCGMDEGTRARIFEPFFTTKAPGSGTGLGMAMVYGLMKQHRGLVHVYSELGRGTTVKLLFPPADAAALAPTPTPAPRAPRASAGRGGTVLVIEDEPALRGSLARMLGRAGHTVLLAADGREGLEIFRQAPHAIDLVLSDLVMPKLGGREVLEAVRREGSDCAFVLVTGYGPGAVADLEDRHLTVVTKPWGPGELLEKIGAAMAARSTETGSVEGGSPEPSPTSVERDSSTRGEER